MEQRHLTLAIQDGIFKYIFATYVKPQNYSILNATHTVFVHTLISWPTEYQYFTFYQFINHLIHYHLPCIVSQYFVNTAWAFH